MIAVVGLSHKTAPIEVRERLALSSETVPELLRTLVSANPISEALVVSTCNRVEVVVAGPSRADPEGLARAAFEAVSARAPGVSAHLYRHSGSAAIRHLFRVAASLDSLVVGEPQILGQLKDAYDVAREVGTAGAVLNRVLPRAIRSAKRVRSETAIGAGQVSVPTVAVDLARQIFGDLGKHTAVLVGSGEMGESVAKLLRHAGARLVVVGRNQARVSELATALAGEGRAFEALEETLRAADVVVTTTSAPGFVVDTALVRRVQKVRKGRSSFFIDLAVPRDVDPAVGELDGVFLYNVDDLSRVVSESLEGRKREAERAAEIVDEEAAHFDRWAEAEQVTPTIVALRERLRSVLEGEIDRSLSGRLRHLGPPDREALAVMVEAALNKMLHTTTARLRKMAVEPDSRAELETAVALLEDLFELAEMKDSLPAATEEPGSSPEAAEAESSPAAIIARVRGVS
ncbi:MAG TPA: glutamyl-tRNA reductase [Polyangiaceae bacterium]|nr:glutamyl-tRNA reductase [Polyangiaceae bacterium]